MNLALREAWKYQGLTYPNPAVGCAIVSQNGAILAIEAHKKAGMPHAEVEALKAAYCKLTRDESILNLTDSADIHTYLLQNHNNCFHEATVFTTLEPCSHVGKTPSCANLLSKLGIKKLFIGSNDSHAVASGGSQIVENAGIEVQEHLMEKECDALLQPFKLSQEKQFVFFKWAQRLDGSVDGGVISSQNSRKLVHSMRDVCDLLVIGGNTVRIDRPTLDARLVGGKAPDVLILSRGKEFDTTIPLFSVLNRKVMIADSLDAIKGYKNIMIEGGREMFELSKEFVDYYLCFISAQMGGEVGFGGVHERFEILNIAQDVQDIIMWMKRG
ncbi:MAG: bifunctional diaminohydroxyphosphoribosylaminopyrimidine deaminase/5-amino-6-(5-phosphoribosylamino)uracil reductase RibD [Sulfurimonas sp.]|uniref:bifunctional diaminohydroxyphosphoribosylaminopyrimidine deaminase/5-amino-6-(5-phosphoribosylamino)uracil reductase RibD n=1 Tax=Sulfurimonas sp. TaxID=2022749 RepID=UPI00262E2856|nr:bifunctional diaminohydroxyphosphoribosylaminopyrimidine deaminase/5-amino-6-(5-phosphoribosylamino)uracil reductase RibD [Sulfurimonas sp.]MDD2651570.1 bifunctional diaminohydroxyphosphoribosylaminopyrimidine deaminase/5-amino-6-(5-phosphoribosylamino)uracil reductase RibD [Sulfurimonas sp.]MDD3451381.1 bifunctional diaminohydroxyphosphoribosylaminopyrimidine deaminase/5-amino-6-(5-phosphoribosylamino)uracil reductase RibD [Sulfurimonas sp.]